MKTFTLAGTMEERLCGMDKVADCKSANPPASELLLLHVYPAVRFILVDVCLMLSIYSSSLEEVFRNGDAGISLHLHCNYRNSSSSLSSNKVVSGGSMRAVGLWHELEFMEVFLCRFWPSLLV